MIDLDKYSQVLEMINTSIIISIPIISFTLYKVYRESRLLLVALIYLGELMLCYRYGIYNEYSGVIKIESLNAIVFLYTIKSIILMSLQNKLGLNKAIVIGVLIINIINLPIITQGNEYSILVMILTNIIVVKEFIVDGIKKNTKKLKNNIQQFQSNKKYIEEWDDKIYLEFALQNKYKNDIIDLNKRVIQSIEEAQIPIFILNQRKEHIYSNDAFKMFVNSNTADVGNVNVPSLIREIFLDSEEIISTIENINNYINKSIITKTKDEKVYKITCLTDVLEEQSVIICMLNNITKSTVIQNELNKSEERSKKLMDILNEGIVIDDGVDVSYINNKALELLHLNNVDKTIKVDDIIYIIDKKYRNNICINRDKILNGECEKILTKIKTKDKKILEIIMTTFNVNEIKKCISIIVDITDLENALSAIEQSGKMYRLLLHTLPEGIMIIESKDKRYSYLNESMVKILKSIGVENLNVLIKRYLNESDYGKFKRFTIDNSKNMNVEIAIIERKEEDHLVCIVRVLDDEHKIQRIKQELDSVNKRGKVKGEFLYNIVNDIKDPINRINKINNGVIKDKEKYNSQYIDNYTELIKQNCNRLIRLSNNIEEINKIENGEIDLNLVKCDIVNIVREITQISKSYTDKKNIRIRFCSSIRKKIVIIDRDKIEKIILNILSNAIKFTDAGEEIAINIEDENEHVCITIKDTGKGIPKEKIDVIFERFEQVDRTLSRGAEGTGVGLYLVKQISKIHNIKLNVKSELDKGSEFQIIIDTNHKFDDIEIDSKIYYNLSDTERVDIEFSDIYFDISS